MRSITHALAWEYWHKSGLYIAVPIYLLVPPALRLLWPGFADPLTVGHVYIMGTLFLGFSLYMAALTQGYDAKTRRMGFPFAQYRLPLTTVRLVFYQMLFSALAITVIFSLFAGEMFLLTGFRPPLVATLLIVTVMAAWVQALAWLTVKIPLMRVAMLAIFYLAFIAIISPNHGVSGFFQMHLGGVVAWQVCVWFVATAAAVIVALAAVARDRRGEALDLQKIKAGWLRMQVRLPQRQRPFASPARAQLWFEMRQKGWLMPVIAGAVLLISVICYFVQPSIKAWVFLIAIYPAISLPIGMYVGRCYHGGMGGMDNFRATRPLGDRALSDSILKTGALTMLSGLAICLLPLLSFILTHNWISIGKLYEELARKGPGGMGILWIPLELLATWAVLGIGMLLSMNGHTEIIKGLGYAYFVVAIVCVLGKKLLPPAISSAFSSGVAIAIGVTMIAGTAWGYRTARRMKFIAPWAEQVAYAILLAAVCVILFLVKAESLHSRILLAGLAALPLAPFPLGPLAIRWNRHR